MGLLDKLNDPYILMQIMGGVGLLGSKRQSQADKYRDYMTKGLLGYAENRKEKEKKEKLKQALASGNFDPAALAEAGYGDAVVGAMAQRFKDQSTAQGKYANQPFYAQGPDGNIKAYQLNNLDGPREIPLPEGFTPAVPMSPIDTGAGYQFFNRFGGQGQNTPQTVPKEIPPEQTPQHRASVKSAEAGAAADVEKAKEAPKELEQATNMLNTIAKLKTHPGRELMTGGSSAIGSLVALAPGTDARDFKELLGQIEGQKFLAAYQQLKGGGQITEIEGKEAKTAISNLQTAQSEEQFMDALNTLEGMLLRAKSKAQQNLGITSRKRFNPDTGKLE